MIESKNLNDQTHANRMLSLDLLKIQAMAMVVLLHATSSHYGLKDAPLSESSVSSFLVMSIRMFCMCAVNCFVLITGYFQCNKVMKLKKLAGLWGQVLFYSVGLYLLLCAIPGSGVEFEAESLIRCALPMMTNQYWFVTCYLLLMLVSPWLNIFIGHLDRQQFRKCLLILLACFSLIPSINIFGDPFGVQNGYSLLWFCVLYLIGAYLKRWPLSVKKNGLIYIGICLMMCLIYSEAARLKEYISVIGAVGNLLNTYNHLLVLASAVMLFHAFVNCRLQAGAVVSKTVSSVAAMSLSVYLLHEHPHIRAFLWQSLVRLDQVVSSPQGLTCRILAATVMIFVSALAIEWVRRRVFALAAAILMKISIHINVSKK